MSGHLDQVQELLPLAAGLLDEARERQVRDHLAVCAVCTERWDELLDSREATGPETRHLPAAMIARWDRVRTDLRGLERTLVRERLARCATCREELRALGLQPELPAATVTPLRTAPPRHGRDWNLFAAGIAVAAIAAVFVLMLGPGRPAPEVAGDAVLPWVAPRLLRGDRIETATVARGTRSISLLVDVPLEADPGLPASLEVRADTGALLLRTDLAPADLARGTLVVVLTRPEPLPEGSYTVTFRQPAARQGSAVVDETVFELRHPGP